jgi:hypothetical protein
MNLTMSYNVLLSLQCNFDIYMCDSIFGLESKHIYPKWVTSQQNIIHFLNTLDHINRKKLLDYASDQFLDPKPTSATNY